MLKSKFLSVATLILVILTLSSCEKDEIPVKAPTAGLIESYEVAMESDYRNQLFYDLETGMVVSENLKSEWDLGFECSSEGWHVITNTAKAMKCAHTDFTDFNQTIDVDNMDWKWDVPSGNLDSTAIKNWTLSPSKVMIIDRGYDWEGTHLGYTELKLLSYSETSYTLEFSTLGSDDIYEFIIIKDGSKNFQCFSLEDSGILAYIQPNKTDWDLVFTQYLASLHDGDGVISYLVVGVLTNHETSYAQQVYDTNFEDIDLDFASTLEFDARVNNIGYDWKFFDFTDGFLTHTDKHYVIKDAEGIFFKLRFLDFYNLDGEKGHPNFELQRL